MKIKKTKKSKKQRGNTTYGHGARKKWKKSGHRGGYGMAGTGKRADQKSTLVQKLYGNKYFGKQGITSKKTAKKRNKVINLKDIEKNLDSLMKKYGNKDVLELKDYKVLGDGKISKIKIKAESFAKSAVEKIEKAGGEAILQKPKQEAKEPEKKGQEKQEKETKQKSKK